MLLRCLGELFAQDRGYVGTDLADVCLMLFNSGQLLDVRLLARPCESGLSNVMLELSLQKINAKMRGISINSGNNILAGWSMNLWYHIA